MATNEYRLRIKNKSDTVDNWARNSGFIPLRGEICVYTDAIAKEISDGQGNSVTVYEPRIKVGDGYTPIGELPYVSVSLEEKLLEHVNNNEIHITQLERIKWNSKLDSEVESTTLNLYNEYS